MIIKKTIYKKLNKIGKKNTKNSWLFSDAFLWFLWLLKNSALICRNESISKKLIIKIFFLII